MSAKKTYTTNQTRVKLVVYYSHRKDGTPYSIYEIQTGRNRRTHDIYEHQYTELKRVVIREDLSIKKALRHIEIHESKIISALIIVNNWKVEEEQTIGKYTRTNGFQFMEPEYKKDAEGNVRICKAIILKRDKMRIETLKFKQQAV
jgi:hypothetical protein